ncbi:hypothetical protein [Roseibium sp. MMSF_3544]|uniref:hypothetical protein n=1 Tax=unclassified Roseibium TaxID=2629323 RepID=UPI00273DD810|nr:hypothetical protein [Roseibium sp. MMSF_3544]
MSAAKRIEGRHQSKARRTCQTLLKKHGAEHLRLVFGLINTPHNRGNWSATVVTAVSWLVLNKSEWILHRDFLNLFDTLDLGALLKSAKELNPGAPTITLAVLLSYELDRMMSSELRGKAA